MAEVGPDIRPPSTRASRADRASRVKVVRPVGRSTLTRNAGQHPWQAGRRQTG